MILSFWCVFAIILGLLTFFIVYNANWLLGDDAVIMKKTGSGISFALQENVNWNGRFFPLAYYAYNILLFFNEGYISATAHYALIAVAFVLFGVLCMSLFYNMIKNDNIEKDKNNSVYMWVALFVSLIVIQRVYPQFQNIFTTIWMDYFLVVVFSFFTYLFYSKQSVIYSFVALVAIVYSTYCLENMFVIPLSFGFISLLFGYHALNTKQKLFNIALILNAVIFLLLYYICVYRNTTSFYDGSHGENISVFGNIVNILLSQKILWLSLIIAFVRLYKILSKKEKFNVYFDTMLFSGLCFVLGCFVLKLNWTMYYSIGVVLTMGSVLYYLFKYIKIKWIVFSLMLLLCLFYVRKFPQYITKNQKNRQEIPVKIESIIDYYNNGYDIVWCDNNNDDDWVNGRLWKKECIRTYIGYELRNKEFNFAQAKSSKSLIFCYSIVDDLPANIKNEDMILINNLMEINLYKIDK
ncbi:hypothetical protein FACS18945_3470 [Bacteroidia bacterium]|nr:hypothetical protein FACS18945_3470 [Bacteroidia bacterium]